VDPVSDAEVEGFYRENRLRLRQPLETIREQIRGHLEAGRRQEALQKLLEESKAATPVVSYLEPWRVEIDDSGAPTRGPAEAPVVVTVFSDFQCPWCRKLVPSLEKLQDEYPHDVRISFRNHPLTSIHPLAEGAALAGVCASEQGRFWPFHDLLFADPSRLEPDALAGAAAEAGLDVEAWEACRGSEEARQRLARDVEEGRRLGVDSTPSVWVDGRPVRLTSEQTPEAQIAVVVEDEIRRGSSNRRAEDGNASSTTASSTRGGGAAGVHQLREAAEPRIGG